MAQVEPAKTQGRRQMSYIGKIPRDAKIGSHRAQVDAWSGFIAK